MIEPVTELTRLAKTVGSRVLIDGAHAPGVLDISVYEIGADYYTGNCHKWLFASKGCAFLWTSRAIYGSELFPPEENLHPQPVVISSSGKYDYLGRFEYTGTRDYIAFCSLPYCWKFIEEKLSGLPTMRKYCTELLRLGCDYLIQQWNTSYLVPLSMTGFMANVLLPSQSREKLTALRHWLYEKHQLTMVFESVPIRSDISRKELRIDPTAQEIFFIRISAQVYLQMNDFIFLAEKVQEFLMTTA